MKNHRENDEEACTSGVSKPFPALHDLSESISEVASLPPPPPEAPYPPPISFFAASKKRKHASVRCSTDGMMSKSFTAATSSSMFSPMTSSLRTQAAVDDIALLPRIRHRKRLSLASRTTSSNSSSLSHSSSLDRVALKRLQDSRRFKRKRSSSLSCIESGSPTPLKQPFHDDLTRSVSFKVREVNGCRAFTPYDLDVQELLGRGFFGEVFKVCHKTTGEIMVLKRLYRIDPKHERTFLKEAAVMRQLDHPNVLKFLGILYKEKQLHLITEFVSGGSLKRVLDDVTQSLSWFRRTGIAKDIAAGMSYLHSMNIIHRDLNSGNVLIREECGSAVVADFGLARLVSRKNPSRRRRYTVVGNPYWMAPEMLKECNYDERVDLFSFGITVCEIIGRCTADPDILPRTPDFGLHQEKFIHEFCANCPQPLVQVAFRCASVDPDLRPPFAVIYDWLDMLKLELDDMDDSESLAPMTLSTEALTREILMFQPSPHSVFNLPLSEQSQESPPVRQTNRKIPGSSSLGRQSKSALFHHRRKISLDLGYEEAGSTVQPDPTSQAQWRCVSADPVCFSNDEVRLEDFWNRANRRSECLSESGGYQQNPRMLNTLFSCSESALDNSLPSPSASTEGIAQQLQAADRGAMNGILPTQHSSTATENIRKAPSSTEDWESTPTNQAGMDVDEQDSAISSHNSSGGSYFS